MHTKFFSARQPLVFIAGALTLLANAHATYTVIEDDLYPTKALMARDRLFDEEAAEKFKVLFVRGTSVIGPNAKLYLDDLVARIQAADKIRIVGRTDTSSATDDKKQRDLAMTRASAVRAYLVKAGIPASSIETDVDTSGNPLSSRGISPVEIAIWTTRSSRSFFADQTHAQSERAIPRSYRYLNQDTETHGSPTSTTLTNLATAAVSQNSQPSPALLSPLDERLIQYIDKAVQTGQMSPAVAAQILASLAHAGTSSQPAQAPAVTASVPATAPAIQPSARIERWKLDARLTLKENLDEWSKASGWHPPLWEASNFYQITKSTYLNGAFPDVLKQIADSTGLNICAFQREKQVRVTDTNVPCRK